MSAWNDAIEVLQPLGFTQSSESPTVWQGHLFARAEAENDRRQFVQLIHSDMPPYLDTMLVSSVVGVLEGSVALRIMGRWRHAVGTLEYTPTTDTVGVLSLVTNVPLMPFAVSDPTSLVNFVCVFAETADKLEEAINGGTDGF